MSAMGIMLSIVLLVLLPRPIALLPLLVCGGVAGAATRPRGSGGTRAQEAEGLDDAAIERPGAPGTVSRVIWEKSTGIYFGYDVDVARDGGGFRLEFRPLEHAAILALARGPDGAGPSGAAVWGRMPRIWLRSIWPSPARTESGIGGR